MATQLAVVDRNTQVANFNMNDIEKIATAIARGGLFGSKDPYAVLTLCMLAHAEGQHPAVVFRDYDLIQGKPAKKAEAMLRDFVNSGGKVEWNRLDDECADATFSHPQGGTVTINWTMARAQKAQLGGKDMWKKYPRQMLRSRTVSEGVRTVYPGATSGLYVPEEVRDFDNAPVSDTPATPQAKRARDLTPIEAKAEPIEQEPDHSGLLADLELAAGNGKDALAKAWDDIGKDARKALADELPRLKGMCAEPADTPRREDDEQPAEVNDIHPGRAKADALIASIGECIAQMDVTALVSRNTADMDAMTDEDRARVNAAADARIASIKEQQAKAREQA